MKPMTKKAFMELCDTNHTYGRGQGRFNTVHFGWQDTENGRGFKAAVAAAASNCTKLELFNIMYDWMVNEVQPPYFVLYRYAIEDKDRFRVPLSFSRNLWS